MRDIEADRKRVNTTKTNPYFCICILIPDSSLESI
jgi:hypothetical protein